MPEIRRVAVKQAGHVAELDAQLVEALLIVCAWEFMSVVIFQNPVFFPRQSVVLLISWLVQRYIAFRIRGFSVKEYILCTPFGSASLLGVLD